MTMSWSDAREWALDVVKLVEPHISRWEFVGSLGRHSEVVHDIDILVEPLGEGRGKGRRRRWPEVEAIRGLMQANGVWIRGGERMMVAGNFFGVENLHVDLFLRHPPAQWGSLLAMRVGPAALSMWAKDQMKERGIEHKQGRPVLMDTGRELPVADEEEFFRLAGIEFVPRAERAALALRIVPEQWWADHESNRQNEPIAQP